MTARIYTIGHLNKTKPEGPAVCERCHKKHPIPWKHVFKDERGKVVWSQCTARVGDDFCPNVALVFQGRFGLHCAAQSVEDGDRIEPRIKGGAYAAFIEKSAELAKELGQPESLIRPIPPITLNPQASRRFYVRSRSRPPLEHCVQLLGDRMTCSCEAGITHQHCWHQEVIEGLILIGVKEVSV